MLTSLSPSVSSSSSSMVLKCSSHTTRLSSRATLSSSSRVPRLSSGPRSPAWPWESSFSSPPTSSSCSAGPTAGIRKHKLTLQLLLFGLQETNGLCVFTWEAFGAQDLIFNTFLSATCEENISVQRLKVQLKTKIFELFAGQESHHLAAVPQRSRTAPPSGQPCPECPSSCTGCILGSADWQKSVVEVCSAGKSCCPGPCVHSSLYRCLRTHQLQTAETSRIQSECNVIIAFLKNPK